MHNFIFRRINKLRQNYWFWPSTMTFGAVLLGFVLPHLDSRLGSEWIQAGGFIRHTQVDGARAILTTLAGATLAGVAFSVTIVAVSFANSNYGPRLICNFMGDKTNQIVLGVFVATFSYCIAVLSTVRPRVPAALRPRPLQDPVPEPQSHHDHRPRRERGRRGSCGRSFLPRFKREARQTSFGQSAAQYRLSRASSRTICFPFSLGNSSCSGVRHFPGAPTSIAG